MDKLYMIRSQNCQTCGLSTVIANGRAMASKNSYEFVNIQVSDPVVKKLSDEWGGLDTALKMYPCVFFNPTNGRFSKCHKTTLTTLDGLF